nr:hypothetical protein [Tanacetum cinerariifolium]
GDRRGRVAAAVRADDRADAAVLRRWVQTDDEDTVVADHASPDHHIAGSGDGDGGSRLAGTGHLRAVRADGEVGHWGRGRGIGRLGADRE